MSKHRNPDVRELLRSLHGLTPDELEDQMGVVMQENGVLDVFDGVHYDTIELWAESQIGKQGEKIHHNSNWD